MKKNDVLFLLGLIAAVWFALTAWIWAYYAALFISYPFGLIAFFIRRSLRNNEAPRNNIISGILISGLIFSIGFLIFAL